jgi:hypothetical protein
MIRFAVYCFCALIASFVDALDVTDKADNVYSNAAEPHGE